MLGLLERFNYPNLAALYAESSELMLLLQMESYGYQRDRREKMELMEAEVANNGQ